MKILVVDDNYDITNMLEMTIESMDHQFDSASGGREGLEKIRANKYDMVMLDLSMPGFSGLEVIDALVKEKLVSRQKIVMFTASYLGVEKLENELQAKGVHSILPKPADIDQIMEKINQVESELL